MQISDGEVFGQGILTSASAPLVTSEQLVVNQLAIIKEGHISTIQSTKFCLILAIAPVPFEEGATAPPEKIGTPVKWDSEEGAAVWNAKAVTVDEGISPKGRPNVTTPQTGGAASRVAPSSFAGGSSQGASQPLNQSPLVASKSVPIEALNPYSNRWQIKARVSNKGELRTYNSAKGEGSVFSVDLSDETGEIRATAFKEVSQQRRQRRREEEASARRVETAGSSSGRRRRRRRRRRRPSARFCVSLESLTLSSPACVLPPPFQVADRLYQVMEVGQTYLIARGQLKMANKKFAALNNNYEITFNFDTQVQLCADEPISKPKVHYRFTPIDLMTKRPKDANVDVIGVVSNVSACTSLTTKAGKELTKRTMQVADDTNRAIEITLWGASAAAFPDLDANSAEVVAFKGLRVTEWNERSLSAGYNCTFELNPPGHEEATERLKAWYENGGAEGVTSLSQDTRGTGDGAGRDTTSRDTIADFQEKGDALSGSDPVYTNVRAFFIKSLAGPGQNGGDERFMWYSSCPKCNKKCVGDEQSGHNCEACGWSGQECSYRYIAPLQFFDSAGSCIMTAFNEQAISILGAKADDLKRLKDQSQQQYEAALGKAQWKQMVLRVRGKMETYNGVTRMKTHVTSAAPVKFAEEGKLLLADIAKYGDLTPKDADEMDDVKPEVKAEAY